MSLKVCGPIIRPANKYARIAPKPILRNNGTKIMADIAKIRSLESIPCMVDNLSFLCRSS